MKKEVVNWKDFSEKSPPPHYLDPESEIIVEYNEEAMKIIGKCLFPSSDPTLKTRNHVNHFYVIMVIDVIFALNVLWNCARIAKEKLVWESMLSITTNSKIIRKLDLDVSYVFEAEVKKAKMDLWEAILKIKNQGNVIAEVSTLARVKYFFLF